jgi:hypothetical protein
MSGTTTSPATTFSVVAFSDAEKADIRRFCGYPTYGGLGSAGFQGWRYYQAYGLLEFRMNNLAPAEIANVRYRLSLLYVIEAAKAASFATLNVAAAGSFIRNRNELRDREAQYRGERRELCNAVGVPPGPDLGNGSLSKVI